MAENKFQGKSNSNNIQEALEDAIQNAIQDTTVADALIHWKLLEITGEEGGIAGVKNLTVTISAES